MAQRDYEEQPEAPDLGASVQLENQQQMVGPPGGDPLDAGYVPPDRPYAATEHGVTGQEMADGESMDQRLAREMPEEESADPDRSGRLTVAGQGAALETADDVDGVDVGIDGGAASAEEAAVHESTDPVSGFESEPSVADLPELADPEVERSLADDPESDRAEREAARDAWSGEDRAARIDAGAQASGASASASGRDDVGPV
ncbi:DUF5709 domain-containing protein [Pseudonocardia humida]|uniref:DUF5709 domain-containing protein n=1 Tax=Pseudonocardia humida TaxID=2800819 RepID=A0ABT0ZYI4_9PSEU|nr:DUF5709 domain-containing protein [Pseudonocardia humida]MCO1655795.1 hypothetical protein [Pseudonocardia humida]